MAISLLIVDDDARFRRFARQLLEGEGFTVVGEAEDGAGALREVAALRPQVVLLDLQLPDVSGLQVARRIANGSGPAVVLTSTRDGASYAGLTSESGACGFVGKMELSGAALRRLVGDHGPPHISRPTADPRRARGRAQPGDVE
jgi:DNA-binding NarL/FixJ family response regulator